MSKILQRRILQTSKIDYVGETVEYAQNIVKGSIVANEFSKLAANRFLTDLDRCKNDDQWPYYFNPKKARHVCQFSELFPHIDFRSDNPFMTLLDFQRFQYVNVFGFFHKDGDMKGFPRFTQSFSFEPRGNGKTTKSMPAIFYMTGLNGEPGAQSYCCASTDEQANNLWDKLRAALQHDISGPFLEKLGFKYYANAITHSKSASYIKKMSCEGSGLEGRNVYFALQDEPHEWPHRRLYSAMKNGATKRKHSLIWTISTAGEDPTGICNSMFTHTENILRGKTVDEAFFGVLYTVDDPNKWYDENEWKKANPAWGVSVNPTMFKQHFVHALDIQAERQEFKIKHLNIWEDAVAPYLNIPKLKSLLDPNLKMSDFKGKKCYIGIDLGQSRDLSCVTFIFPEVRIEKIKHADGAESTKKTFEMTLFMSTYSTKDGLDLIGKPDYKQWAKDGFINVTEALAQDYSLIFAEILRVSKEYQIEAICVDRFNGAQLYYDLKQAGLRVEIVPQTVMYISPPSKELDKCIRHGNFHYNNPVFLEMASNCVIEKDNNGNIFPKKDNKDSVDKIDGVRSALNAVAVLIDNDWMSAVSADAYYFTQEDIDKKIDELFGENGKYRDLV